MKKLAVDMSSFGTIIRDDYLYIDKTQYIYEMVSKGKYYFLSRPRRFGKSLTVSTLEALFKGEKELFEGLYIEGKYREWDEYPIIKLDFNRIANDTSEKLKKNLKEELMLISKKYEIDLLLDDPENMFKNLIEKLSEKYKKGVVILVDEYDKPIISHLGEEKEKLDIGKANREILKVFYDNLKPLEDYIRFVFITGVSKFSKVSIFSTLNNLIELDIHQDFATFLGYTKEELHKYFDEYIEMVAKSNSISKEEMYLKIKEKYNGFRFTEEEYSVYNPFSIGRLCIYKKLKNYWFESGTPTFLVNLMKARNYDVTEMENLELEENSIIAYDIERLQLEPLMFQTGYLTIKDYEYGIYKLGYPNKEVEQGFTEQLISSYVGKNEGVTSIKMMRHFARGEYEEYFELMKGLFAKIPYILISKDLEKRELYYHSIFYMINILMKDYGYRVYAEVLTNKGRIDMVIETKDMIHIVEFKCNQNVDIAIKQIREKGYAKRYMDMGKEIYLVGVNFDTEKKNISEWKMEKREG
ncbi:ATP-binding protein [Haliovirga abyssi]|uniref:ATPase AAA n=1 Tax=Haliovirga abyssi TaxID=2996794 RepID=A0AAU9D4Y8_9FUSO|nr:ATP-binding protein [Haliovirga abyssi]BDU51116.1 ATPase AAA [Haliovirga abyssi]